MSAPDGGQPADLSMRLLRWLAYGGGGHARGVLRVWPLWERIARRIWPTTPLPNTVYGSFDIHLRHHHGAEVLLADGTRVQPGDHIVEIHMNNRVVADLIGERYWNLAPTMRADLRVLADWLTAPDFPPDVKAIYGLTLVRGAIWLGFTLRERPVNLLAWFDRLFMTGLLALYAADGKGRLVRGTTFGSYPQEIWLSRAELMRRYGPGAPVRQKGRSTGRADGAR